jgi:hypothetical protein
LDGDFSAFQRKISSLEVKFSENSVDFPTLRGESLSFGWQGPFQRNGKEEPLSGFSHYEHPYVVSEDASHQLELRFGENALRLSFGRVESSEIEQSPPGL